ncbi:MAG: hydrogenase expression/formation protein HypE [Bacteroidales bacterium]|nr:hydrogenase expression/formation protein HypE [Bacteroidales bacterium]
MNYRIEIGHGSGGQMTRRLIRDLFMKNFRNKWLDADGDSAVMQTYGNNIAMTTDSHVVSPIFFPGGDLGKLAVCGTVNDLAVVGAKPEWITAGFILEEGLSINTLERIVISMADEARKAGVHIVAGDTKVVKKGQADQIYINTAGVGTVDDKCLHISSGKKIKNDDVILINGTIGDHEAAIINAREQFFESSRLRSDCASVNQQVHELLNQCNSIKFMRDVTRGGLAGILTELANMTENGIEIKEADIPCNDAVMAFCETLGFDPLQLANEGRFVTILSKDEAQNAMEILNNFNDNKPACIGLITSAHPGQVVMETAIGGKRLIETPWAAKTPRIC